MPASKSLTKRQITQIVSLIAVVVTAVVTSCSDKPPAKHKDRPSSSAPARSGAKPEASGSGDGTPTRPSRVSAIDSDGLVTIDHGGFKLLYDCDRRSALRYEYELQADRGSVARPEDFKLDPELPKGCGQQFNAKSYASVKKGWDRGHLVTSNHMDYNATYIERANYMTNIAPQASQFNQGIWIEAENVAECYRDLAPVKVYGGVVYGTDRAATQNDYFVESHGIRTPEYFWKAVVTTKRGSDELKVIAWLIPNRDALGPLDKYMISITDLEKRVGASLVKIELPAALKNETPTRAWVLPQTCSLK
jgi:endonuclease G